MHPLEGLITAQPCPICLERANKPGVCDECGAALQQPKLGKYHGYQAVTVDHRHQRVSGGERIGGASVARKKLCLDCYRKDFHVVYPDQPLPV